VGNWVCKGCGEERDSSEFAEKQKVLRKTGLKIYKSCYCTSCRKARSKKYREKRPYSWIQTRYKLSKEEAKYWYERSKTSCEICGIAWKEGSEALCVDHDHITGEVRGILCKHCNHVLGHSRDSVEILSRAKIYLQVHQGKQNR